MNRLQLSILLMMSQICITGWCDESNSTQPAASQSSKTGTVKIRGDIRNTFGQTISRVEVRLESYGNSKDNFVGTTETDDNGQFLFDNVQAGTYRLSAEKNRWESKEKLFTIQESQAGDEIAVSLVMKLTLLYQMMAYLQFGSLTYVVFFGLLVFVANFFIAPRPVPGVTVFGWAIVFLSLTITWFKMEWTQALPLTLFGCATGLLIQTWGRRVASRRTRQEDELKQVEDAANQQQREDFQSLVGKSGVATTDLKACGSVGINGDLHSAKALRGYIPQGTKIVVLTVEGTMLIVEPK